MRNKYTKEFEDFIRKNAKKYNREELRQLAQSKFNIKISKDSFRRYLNRHKIKALYNIVNNVREVYRLPIGTERITDEGVFIKVAQPDKWRRKSRVMYEKYHNCKLNDDDYILFLNQDRNDFSKENLFKSTNREKCYLHNWGTFSKNPELTKTGILSARVTIKAKEKGELNERSICNVL